MVQLAEKSGISQPFLSRLENGRALPSVASLYSMADALGVTVSALLNDRPSEDVTVTREGQGPLLVNSNAPGAVDSRLITAPSAAHGMTGMVHTLRSGDLSRTPSQHPGEDLIYVLSGRVAVRVGDRRHELGAGDSAHFDGRQPHCFEPLGDVEPDEQVRVLIVTSPNVPSAHLT